MRRITGLVVGGAALVVLGLAGCGSVLKDDRTVSVNPGEWKAVEYSAPKKEQKVVIDFTATGGPVSAYVVLQKDREAADKAVDANRMPANTLASRENASSGKLEATIPAGAAFVLLVVNASGKPTDVQVKANSQ